MIEGEISSGFYGFMAADQWQLTLPVFCEDLL